MFTLRVLIDKVPKREFLKIKTWDEFMRRWGAVPSEQEAVGLLYAGTSIGIDKEKVVFYLAQTESSSQSVAFAAQQIVVKDFLGAWACSCRWDEDAFEVHHAFLSFLQKTRSALVSPPYPRFISRYLLSLYEQWPIADANSQSRGWDWWERHSPPLAELLVRALVLWGMGYVLGKPPLRLDAIPVLKKVFKEMKLDFTSVIVRLSGDGEPISDFVSSDSKHLALERAAFALLRLEYELDGVHARSDQARIHGFTTF